MESGNSVTSKSDIVNKTLMIFGGAGSLGQTLVKQYLPVCKKIYVVSRDEAKHWDLHNDIKSVAPDLHSKLHTVIGDVRDDDRIQEIIDNYQPQNIIIAQALKQVDICELYPEESIKTNILGVNNIIKAIESYNNYSKEAIKNVCFVSTDKACNPINVYGMCKRISEKLILAAAKHSKTKYIITRYGNVLSSKGSIVPLFLKQANDSNCHSFTVTDVSMTRFLMTLDESVELIDKALKFGNNGEIWVPKLKSIKIIDLANYFSVKFNKPITIVGVRLGEKLHEALLSEEELAKSNLKENCFVVTNVAPLNALKEFYSSEACTLSLKELNDYMDSFLTSQKSF